MDGAAEGWGSGLWGDGGWGMGMGLRGERGGKAARCPRWEEQPGRLSLPGLFFWAWCARVLQL